MAQINGVNLQGLASTSNVKTSQTKGYSYLLKQPIQDSVDFSSTKKS